MEYPPQLHGGPHPFPPESNHRISDAATLLQIRFLDHVIIGEPAPGRAPYFSFRVAGII